MSQLILKQIARTRPIIAKTLEDVSSEACAIIPEGFNNNIHWQLGHILVTGDFFFLKGNEVAPAEFGAFFGPRTKPADWSGDVPSVETVLDLLQKQADAIQAVDVSTFDTKLEAPILGNETIGEFAAMGAFHESFHVGQIHALKRVVSGSLVK